MSRGRGLQPHPGQPSQSSNIISAGLIQRLNALNHRGVITAEGFRLYLNNPEVVWVAADELTLARRTSVGLNPVEAAMIFTDIVLVTREQEDLYQVIGAWVGRPPNPASQAEIGYSLVKSYLACGLPDQAIGIADAIPLDGRTGLAWIKIAAQTGSPEHFQRARALISRLEPMEGEKLASLIARKSKDPADLAEYEACRLRFHTTPDNPVAEEWRKVGYAEVLAEFGRLEEAREVVQTIMMPRVRIAAGANLIRRTKDEDDLAALILYLQQMGEVELAPGSVCEIASSYLLCGRVDRVRAFGESQNSAARKCLVFALLATDPLAEAADLRRANTLGRMFSHDTAGESFARLRLVRALVTHESYGEAKFVAVKIRSPLTRCRAYLAIHQAIVGKSPTSYSDENQFE